MKICFMGTHTFSLKILSAIIENNYPISCVYTKVPKAQGRGHKVVMSPVHQFALSNNIPVRTPKTFKKIENQEEFIKENFDVCIVASYGLILPKAVLNSPKHGCINTHASILPRWRGASPIQMAIASGDKETGVTLMQMDEGLDTGDIISVSTTPITNNTTSQVLYDRLADIGAKMIIELLHKLKNHQALSKTQQPLDGVTYAPILKKEQGLINFSQTAQEIEQTIRGFENFPSSFFYYNEELIKVFSAKVYEKNHNYETGTIVNNNPFIVACKNSFLEPIIMQKTGKKPLENKEFVKGYKFIINDKINSFVYK